MTDETPASILLRYDPRLRLPRAALIRVAAAAQRVLAAGPGAGRRADILIGSRAQDLHPGAVRLSRAAFARLAGSASLERGVRSLLARAPSPVSRPPTPAPAASGAPRGAVLLFRRALNSPDKELGVRHMHQGAFYLASALRRAGIRVLWSESRLALGGGDCATDLGGLDTLLAAEPQVNLVGLTVYDACFEAADALLRHIRSRSAAFVAAGGLMPTTHPYETLAHLSGAHFVVRGAGEELLPRLMASLSGADASRPLGAAQLESLRCLGGLGFFQEGTVLLSGSDRVLRIPDLDRSALDFSLLGREETRSGAVLCLSRGCASGCHFCSSPDQGRFHGKSPQAVARDLAAYGRRLRDLYGRWSAVPPAAFGLGFYDDDFLADPERAAAILGIVARSPFHIRFLQCSIRSFFSRRGGRLGSSPRKALLEALKPGVFSPRTGGEGDVRPFVYLGTENLCDAELRRLGKGYSFKHVETVVRELSRRGIRQAHHWIVSNMDTSLEDILENLLRINRLRWESGGNFDVLRPVIPHLTSFFPTASYRRAAAAGRLGLVRTRRVLSAGLPGRDLDYPLVDHDLPEDPEVRRLAGEMPALADGGQGAAVPGAGTSSSCGGGADWDDVFGSVLYRLLLRSESLAWERKDPRGARRLRALVDRYHDYPALARSGRKLSAAGLPGAAPLFAMTKANMQLFVTRRCQLRCRYCPVAKRDADMPEAVMRRAVGLLMTHRGPAVRLDLGGGEPFLRPGFVGETLRCAEAAAAAAGKSVSFYMVTNGIALDAAALGLLRGHDVRLEISLDGTPEDHNRWKVPHEPGLDPYRATRRGLDAALRAGVPHTVVLVASPGNCGRLAVNVRHVVDAGAREVEVNYALGVRWGARDSRLLLEGLSTVADRYRDRLRSGSLVLGNLRGRVEPALLNAELMADTDGSLHLMSEWMFETRPPCGAPVYRFGRLGEVPDINALYWTRFHSYYTLLRLYHGAPEIRRVILDNIRMGERVAAHMAVVGEKVFGKGGEHGQVRTA